MEHNRHVGAYDYWGGYESHGTCGEWYHSKPYECPYLNPGPEPPRCLHLPCHYIWIALSRANEYERQWYRCGMESPTADKRTEQSHHSRATTALSNERVQIDTRKEAERAKLLKTQQAPSLPPITLPPPMPRLTDLMNDIDAEMATRSSCSKEPSAELPPQINYENY